MLKFSAVPCLYIISSNENYDTFESLFAEYNRQHSEITQVNLTQEDIHSYVFVIDLEVLEAFLKMVDDPVLKLELLNHSFVLASEGIPQEQKLKWLEMGFFFVSDGSEKIVLMKQKLDWLLARKSNLATKLMLIEKYNQKLQIQRRHIREQNELLQMAVHDLRSPLSAMIVYAEMLMDGVLDEFKHNHNKPLEIIHQNCKFLINMVNDLLESAKLEAGKKQMKLEKVDFLEILNNMVLSLKGLASEKRISVETEIETIPELIGNPQMLERVVINLYSNAIKFTKSGGKILIKILKKKTHVVFSIQDEGPGISKKDADKIFEKFNVGDDSSITGKGHGLGLAITKSFVELHGGRIFVKSRRHKGSTFIVHLSLSDPEMNQIGSEEKKILILDEKYDCQGLNEFVHVDGVPVEYHRTSNIKLDTINWRLINGLVVNGSVDISKLNNYLTTVVENNEMKTVPCYILVDELTDAQNYDYLQYLKIYFEAKPIDIENLKKKISDSVSVEKDSVS